MDYPTFYAVAKSDGTHLALTINGLPTKQKAEAHLKQLGHELVSFEASRDAAEQKANTENQKAPADSGVAKSVLDELT